MITNQQLASLIQGKLNGAFNAELGEYENIHKYGLDGFPNFRYEFRIFADNGEYSKAENRGATANGAVTNTVTQYINGVLKTPGGASVEGASADTYNAAVEAQIELLIPNCDDVATFTEGEDSVTVRLQDAVSLLVQQTLGLPTTNYEVGEDGIRYLVGAQYSHASTGERRHRTQAGLSVILTLYLTFAIVAMGVSSREIVLTINGEQVYWNRISISRASTQENNVEADPSNATGSNIGVARARTTATQLVIGFSAPVRPTALNKALVRYTLLGEVTPLAVTLEMPTDRNTETGTLNTVTGTYTMIFAEGGVAGEENLNAAYDIRLVEQMEDESEATDG